MSAVLQASITTNPPRPPEGRDWLRYGVLALAAHAALLAAWRSAGHDARPAFHEQIVELVRPSPEPPAAEPPPPPPPPPRVQQSAPPPAPALRTHAADNDVAPQALTIPENTTAAPSTAPVVAAPPAPPPVPAPKAEEPLTEATANAAYLKNPAPAYPAAAQRRGLQGTVILRVRVLPDGSADQVEVQQSSGHRLLDEAAVEAVRRWSFVPAMRGKTAQAGWARVPVEFRLGS